MDRANQKKRIGIVVCSNTNQDMNCNCTMCLLDYQRGKSAFAGGEETELVGIISCAGCPTLAAPEKILHRIKPRVDLGMETLHMSSCMTILCPFKAKYRGVIQKAFPSLKIVEGTHFPPENMSPEDAGKAFMEGAREMLCASRPAMAGFAKVLYPDQFGCGPDFASR